MKQRNKILLYAILVISLVVVINLRTVGVITAQSNPPVYVLGVSNATDPLVTDLQNLTSSVTLLVSVTALASLSPGSILFIDGSWLASASSLNPTIIPTIIKSVLAGLPTVVVRGDPSVLPNSITGLMKYDNPGLPLIAEGVHAIGTLPGGTVEGMLLRVISGFDYSVTAEYQWAVHQLSSSGTPLVLAPMGTAATPAAPIYAASTTFNTPGSFWQFVGAASTDTGNQFSPYGRVITTLSLYFLENSGSSSFKWFDVFSNQTIVPGIQAFQSIQSNYRNYQESSLAIPNNQTSNLFVSNGPATQSSSGPFTASYSIGTTTGAFNATVDASQSMSYFMKNANIVDNSTTPYVSWTHTVTGGTDAGKLTLQVIPGWTDRVIQTGHLDIRGNLQVTFATFMGSSTPTSTATTGLSFGIVSGL